MPIVGGLDIHRRQITFDYLGQADAANKRITDALGAQDTQLGSEPGDERDDDSAQAS